LLADSTPSIHTAMAVVARSEPISTDMAVGAHAFRGKERVPLTDKHGADWSEWPDYVPQVRQMPRAAFGE
jgi:hypothetical protein